MKPWLFTAVAVFAFISPLFAVTVGEVRRTAAEYEIRIEGGAPIIGCNFHFRDRSDVWQYRDCETREWFYGTSPVSVRRLSD